MESGIDTSTVVDTSTQLSTETAPVVETAPEVTAGGVPETDTGKGAVVDTGEAAAAAAAANQYTPNFKYKVMDKEHEIPEKFRALLKDADSEKEVREIFEKSMGIDVVKQKLGDTRTERDQWRGKASNFEKAIGDLRTDYQRKDFDSFFNKLQIPEQDILQWVLSKVNYSKLPPEQKALVDQQKAADQRAFSLERQNLEFQEQALSNARLAKDTQMDFNLARPEIQTVAQSFDTRIGKPGAFKEAVRSHGESVWLRSQGKTDLTPDQAIKEVMELYGLKALAPASSGATTLSPGVIPAGTEKTKVIPSIAGRNSTSPVSSKVKSLDDIMKIRKEKFGA